MRKITHICCYCTNCGREFVRASNAERHAKKCNTPIVRISVEAGTDARVSSKVYRVPLRIFANDKLIFEWRQQNAAGERQPLPPAQKGVDFVP